MNVATWQMCSTKCTANSKCLFWKLKVKAEACFLKSEVEKKDPVDGEISGNRVNSKFDYDWIVAADKNRRKLKLSFQSCKKLSHTNP